MPFFTQMQPFAALIGCGKISFSEGSFIIQNIASIFTLSLVNGPLQKFDLEVRFLTSARGMNQW